MSRFRSFGSGVFQVFALFLAENVKEIRIPREGDAVLVANPDGLARALGVHTFGDPEGSRQKSTIPIVRIQIELLPGCSVKRVTEIVWPSYVWAGGDIQTDSAVASIG